MKRIEDIIAKFESLEREMLEDFIARGWLRPARDEADHLFEAIDLARLNLVYELHFTMEIPVDSTNIIPNHIEKESPFPSPNFESGKSLAHIY